jgi:predicted metal-binding membrane protein
VSSGLAVDSRRTGLGLRSGQLAVIGLLLALALIAWVVTDLRMAGMDAGPGTDPGAFGFYLSTWVVMMAAMMFPSIAPMVLMFRSISRGRSAGADADRATSGATGLFVAGYLLVWGISGLIGYAILKLGRSLDGGLFAWDRAGRWTAVAVLLGAALYEFTPAKNACLTRCRSPLAFLMGSWKEGRLGALRMGFEHGGWCLGCCWALMAALFALGAMSLAWMLLIGALIAAEKLLPWRTASTAGVSVVLAALAIGIAASPSNVPALTVPGSPAAMRAMGAMGMHPKAMGMHPKAMGMQPNAMGMHRPMKGSGSGARSSSMP